MARRILAATLTGCTLLACAPADPRDTILSERARWEVRALEWVRAADGSIQVGTRLSGPPNSAIQKLTVRIDLLGAQGAVLRQDWHTFDLAGIPRGGPADRAIHLPPLAAAEVEGVSIDTMPDPTEEESGRIVELAPVR